MSRIGDESERTLITIYLYFSTPTVTDIAARRRHFVPFFSHTFDRKSGSPEREDSFWGDKSSQNSAYRHSSGDYHRIQKAAQKNAKALFHIIL
jgi:hypothetical protein